MGWTPGEGLGKDGDGPLEPLTLDVKSDRKGILIVFVLLLLINICSSKNELDA